MNIAMRRGGTLLALSVVLTGAGSSVGHANVLPESAILVHVQPVSGDGCATAITHCSEIVRSTTESGLLEFQVYFYPVAYQEEHHPIRRMVTDLTWPAAWQLVSWEACGGGAGSLVPIEQGRRLTIDWPSCAAIPGQMFLAASFVMNVQGPGRFDFVDPFHGNDVRLRCDAGVFDAYAFGFDAEASMDCEFTTADCASPEHCAPRFERAEIVLAAPQGGAANGSTLLESRSYAYQLCPMEIDTRAAWATAEVIPHDDWPWNGLLLVTADAGELDPGVYETQVQLYAPWNDIARCVHVVFEVESTVSVPNDDSPPSSRDGSWGRVRALYR